MKIQYNSQGYQEGTDFRTTWTLDACQKCTNSCGEYHTDQPQIPPKMHRKAFLHGGGNLFCQVSGRTMASSSHVAQLHSTHRDVGFCRSACLGKLSGRFLRDGCRFLFLYSWVFDLNQKRMMSFQLSFGEAHLTGWS